MRIRSFANFTAPFVLGAVLAVAPAAAVDRPNFNRAYDEPQRQVAAEAVDAPGAVAARVADNGPASFIWSAGKNMTAKAGATAEQAARAYIAQHAAHYGVDKGDLATLSLQRVHDIGRGAIIAIFGQRVAGHDVEGARIAVTMKRDLSLVAIAGTVVPAAVTRSRDGAIGDFDLTPAQALSAAFQDLFDLNSNGSWHADGTKDGATVFTLLPSAEAALDITLWAPSRVWQTWFAMPSGLVPAYKLEILATEATGDASYEYVVNAADGSLLRRRNLTDSEQAQGAPESAFFSYKVFGETTGIFLPFDGPISDVTPHPTGTPDGTAPTFIPPNMISLDGFGALPIDPWLPLGAVTSTGNNVDAYADIVAPDGFTPATADTRAETTSVATFDYLYDTSVGAGTSLTQTKAAIVNLFYLNNWLHDYYYDSGFDEAAGNAQQSNYGRGGVEGDPIHAESDDYLGTNNANMNTPGDGASPRMQMYKWTGLVVAYLGQNAPAGPNLYTTTAGWGAQVFNVTADLALFTDTGGVNPTDGCEAPATPGSLTGKIALVDRGNCNFTVKAANSQADGAVGVVIANNAAGDPIPMGGSDPTITIGALMVSQANGVILKNNLIAGTTNVTMYKEADAAQRSGSLDTHIVSHEWGHYFHHRLQSCGTKMCGAQSEGWGDTTALHTMIESGDNYGAAYGAAIYSTAAFGPNAAYYGIRRYPYSTDFTKNGLTFKHITDGQALPVVPTFPNASPNSEVHNAGEIWATMTHQAYVALLTDGASEGTARLTFDEARRRMADYSVEGLQSSPLDSTFTETRDGILAAAYANDVADFEALANAFAVRGLGTCAVSPPRDSQDNTGLSESFTLSGRMGIGTVTFADDVSVCRDDDGYLDPLESGTVSVAVQSLGPAPLVGTTVTAVSDNPHVTFPSGNVDNLGTINFGSSENATFEVALDANAPALSKVTFTVTANDPDTCVTEVVATGTMYLVADEAPSTTDNVEANGTTWTFSGSPDLWFPSVVSGSRVWHGVDSGSGSDTRLESAAIAVAATGSFIVEFDHRFRFEDNATFYDGGVIEFSTDGGTNWADLSTLITMPYTGVVVAGGGNALENRNAFTGSSTGYPAFTHVSLNLGTQVASQSVMVRFRIGTDGGVGAAGWDIDNIKVTNATNEPFLKLVGDSPNCAPNYLFLDDFESGSTFAWSAQVP